MNPVNGLYVALCAFALLGLLAAWTYAEWKTADRQRRHRRLVQRQLHRIP